MTTRRDCIDPACPPAPQTVIRETLARMCLRWPDLTLAYFHHYLHVHKDKGRWFVRTKTDYSNFVCLTDGYETRAEAQAALDYLRAK
jgi:hypothetical protein